MLNTELIEYSAESQDNEIPDRVRRIKFHGRMIGKSSTQREGGGPRWTDITIYVTDGGQYVIQREGVSLVYHRAESACRGGELVTNSEITEDSVPCDVCRPPDLDGLDDIRESSGADEDTDLYRREVTMSSVDVVDSPSKIVPILTYKGRLTTVATDAIRRAMENDPRVGGVFEQVEVIA